MSRAALKAVEKANALDRVVEVAKRMEEHEEIDRWEFSDDVKEAVDELSEAKNGFNPQSGVNSGLNEALDKIRDEIKKAGAPTVASQQTVRGAYHVGMAWPSEQRVKGANYWAHFELRAREYDGRRQAILKRLVRDSSTGYVGTPTVRRWKSDQRSVDLTSRDEKLERSLRSALKRWASPQKFSSLHEDERSTAAQILRRLSNEIVEGTFE